MPRPAQKPEPLAYGYSDAATAIGISRRSIERLVASKVLIPTVIVGRKVIPAHQLKRIARDGVPHG